MWITYIGVIYRPLHTDIRHAREHAVFPVTMTSDRRGERVVFTPGSAFTSQVNLADGSQSEKLKEPENERVLYKIYHKDDILNVKCIYPSIFRR